MALVTSVKSRIPRSIGLPEAEVLRLGPLIEKRRAVTVRDRTEALLHIATAAAANYEREKTERRQRYHDRERRYCFAKIFKRQPIRHVIQHDNCDQSDCAFLTEHANRQRQHHSQQPWQPPHALHPTIGVHTLLVFDVFDTWNDRAVAGFSLNVSHPGGASDGSVRVGACR